MATDQRPLIRNSLQNDPKLEHPRAGQAAKSAAEKAARDSATRELLLGRDGGRDALCRIAAREGIPAAEGVAAYYGLPLAPFRAEYEDRQRAVQRQASVQYGPADDQPPRQVADRSMSRVGVDYLDDPQCMMCQVRGLSWNHPEFVAARAAYDERVPYTAPSGEMGVPGQLAQRSHVSTNPAGQYNADVTPVEPAPKRARLGNIPTPLGLEPSQ